ncbi:MAG: diguanylate cyclase [Granulosicoccus sp.]
MKPTVLRMLLIAVMLVVQLATVLFVFLNLEHKTTTQIARNAERSISRLTSTVADQTRRFLSPAESALQLGSRLISTGGLDASDDYDLERFFIAQLQSNEWLNGLYLGRSDGSFVFVSRSEGGFQTKFISLEQGNRAVQMVMSSGTGLTRHTTDNRADTYDPRNRNWFLSARESGELIWTDAYSFFSSGMPGISAAMPVATIEGTDAGVLGVDIDIQQLSAFIGQVAQTGHGANLRGSAVLIDKAGHVVASSDRRMLTTTTAQQDLPDFASNASKALTFLMTHTKTRGDPFSTQSGNFERLEIDGNMYLGMAQPFTLPNGDANWLLLVQAPQAGYTRDLPRLFKNNLATILITVMLPLIVALVAIIGLTQPVYKLHKDATTDRLTGALNRNEFDRRLQELLNVQRRTDKSRITVLTAMDLDGFKRINDEFGHAAGDAVLQIFTTRLRSLVRESDPIGRTGGDEFMFVMQLEPTVDALLAVERVQNKLTGEPIKTSYGELAVGVTAGVAIREENESIKSLMSRADMALIRGKRSMKNQTYLAPPVDEMTSNELTLGQVPR